MVWSIATPRRTADRILAIINHTEETVLILQSDLRPDLNDKSANAQ